MKLFHVLFIALCATAWSATTIEREFICPLDQYRWTQRVETSGRAEALRLDSREVGREVVQPPTLPQCPHCNFVLFDGALDEDAIRRLKAFVGSNDYKSLAAKSSPYSCLATVQELLAAPAFHVGYSYLRAAWAAEASEAQCRRLLTLARAHFERALEQMKPEGKDFINLALMCGEIERRTGKWDEATARFIALRPVIAASEPKYEAIISQQLALIVRHDSRPHIVGARPNADPAPVTSSNAPRIALRSEPPAEPPQKPKPPAPTKVPDLAQPFAAGNPGTEPIAVRPMVIKLPAAETETSAPNAEPSDPAFADSPPPIEVQPIPEGLPDAEPLPEPIPLDKEKPKPVKKTKPLPANDKKIPKPKVKPAP